MISTVLNREESDILSSYCNKGMKIYKEFSTPLGSYLTCLDTMTVSIESKSHIQERKQVTYTKERCQQQLSPHHRQVAGVTRQ